MKETTLDTSARDSYKACENIARKRARNFYYAFTVLPKAKRQAICAMYAFMRYCDDISDQEGTQLSKTDALSKWRGALDAALQGEYGRSRILPAFHHTVRKFGIPANYFHELIDGAEMDLTINRYQTFDDLYRYCYKVSSVVGLVCIHIFGFRDDSAKDYAERCGIAFQLTNILRDVKEDAGRNRIYLPLEDLAKFGCSEEDILNGVVDSRFRDLMRFEVTRARDFYDQGMPLVRLVDATSRAGLTAMIGIYSTLLNKIEAKDYDVFSRRIALSTAEKLAIAARSVSWPRSNRRRRELTVIEK
jgi:15-cis-phytoene synthase